MLLKLNRVGIVLTWFYWSYECIVTWHVTCDTIGTVSPGRGNADWRRARTVNISVTVAMLSMLVYMTMTMLIPGAELLFMCPRGPGTWHCHTSPLQPASFSSANIIGCEMAEMDICPGFYKWQDVLRDGAHGNLNISLCKFVPIQWEKLMLVSGV